MTRNYSKPRAEAFERARKAVEKSRKEAEKFRGATVLAKAIGARRAGWEIVETDGHRALMVRTTEPDFAPITSLRADGLRVPDECIPSARWSPSPIPVVQADGRVRMAVDGDLFKRVLARFHAASKPMAQGQALKAPLQLVRLRPEGDGFRVTYTAPDAGRDCTFATELVPSHGAAPEAHDTAFNLTYLREGWADAGLELHWDAGSLQLVAPEWAYCAMAYRQ